MRYPDAEGLLYLGFVQHGEARPADLAGELRAVARPDVASRMARVPGDRSGEVVPRADSFVGEVVYALPAVVLPPLHDLEDRTGQIPGVGRRADLIEHDAQAVALGGQAEHRSKEVVPELGVEPCGAEDQIAAAAFGYRPFASQLRASVGSRRVGRVVLGVGRTLVPPEDVVRRYVDQHGPSFAGRGGQVCHGAMVEQVRRGLVLLCPVYVRIGRAVDDHVRLLFPHRASDRIGIGDVQLGHVGEDVPVRAARRRTTHLAPELPVGSGDQHRDSLA